MRDVATFTLTRAMPGSPLSARSIERLHDAHRMPSAANTARARPAPVDQNACVVEAAAAAMAVLVRTRDGIYYRAVERSAEALANSPTVLRIDEFDAPVRVGSRCAGAGVVPRRTCAR